VAQDVVVELDKAPVVASLSLPKKIFASRDSQAGSIVGSGVGDGRRVAVGRGVLVGGTRVAVGGTLVAVGAGANAPHAIVLNSRTASPSERVALFTCFPSFLFQIGMYSIG
jgi:hypothetical protein